MPPFIQGKRPATCGSRATNGTFILPPFKANVAHAAQMTCVKMKALSPAFDVSRLRADPREQKVTWSNEY